MVKDARPIMWVLLIGAAVTVVAAMALRRGAEGAPPAPPREQAPPPPESARVEPSEPPKPGPIAHPPSAFAELYVLTDLADAQIAPLLEPKAVAALLDKKDPALRAFLDAGIHFEIEPPGEVKLPRELALAAAGLTDDERASLKARRAIVVRAEGEAFPDQLPARTAYAISAGLADETKGFVYDDLTERVERAVQLRARTTTKDRIDVQYAARDDGRVRLLTAGLRRFGCADIDVAEVDPRYAQAMSDVLNAAAEACVRGADTNPVTLTLPAPAQGDAPVYLVPMEPEPDDPSDYMARLTPEGGATAAAYAGLAMRFYGDAVPRWDPPPDESALAAQRAQKLLPDLLARTKKNDGTTLFVEVLLDAAPGDDSGAPPDTAWIEVKSFDATTVSGTLTEDAETEPSLELGAPLTRPRSAVVDYQLQLADGAIEDL